MTVITEYIKPAQNYEMELEDILDAQMEKIAKDHEWMKDWSTNYEGYRPIGEANISIRPPINRTNSKTICTVKVPVKPPRSKGKVYFSFIFSIFYSLKSVKSSYNWVFRKTKEWYNTKFKCAKEV